MRDEKVSKLHVSSRRPYELTVRFMIVCSIPGFGGSEESAAAEKLLECFDQGDAEQLKICTSRPLFKYLDNEVTYDIVRTMKCFFNRDRSICTMQETEVCFPTSSVVKRKSLFKTYRRSSRLYQWFYSAS